MWLCCCCGPREKSSTLKSPEPQSRDLPSVPLLMGRKVSSGSTFSQESVVVRIPSPVPRGSSSSSSSFQNPLQEQNQQLHVQLASSQKAAAAAQQEIGQLRSVVREREREIDLLRQSSAEAQRALERLKKSASERDDLLQKVRQQSPDSLKDALIADLNQQVNNQSIQLEQLRSSLEDSQIHRGRLLQKVSRLQQEAEPLDDALKQARTAAESAYMELADAQRQLNLLRDRCHELERENGDLQAAFKARSEELDILSFEKRRNEKRLTESRQEALAFRAESEKLASQGPLQEEQQLKIQEELEMSKGKVRALEAQIHALKQTVEEARETERRLIKEKEELALALQLAAKVVQQKTGIEPPSPFISSVAIPPWGREMSSVSVRSDSEERGERAVSPSSPPGEFASGLPSPPMQRQDSVDVASEQSS